MAKATVKDQTVHLKPETEHARTINACRVKKERVGCGKGGYGQIWGSGGFSLRKVPMFQSQVLKSQNQVLKQAVFDF